MKRSIFSDGLEGAGAALLLLATQLLPWVSPYHLTIYHHHLPVTNLIGGLLIDLIGSSVLAAGSLIIFRHFPATVKSILSATLAGLFLWRFLDIALHLQSNVQVIAFWDGTRRFGCAGILILSALLAFLVPRITHTAVRAVRMAIASFAFCCVWIVPQLVFIALSSQPDQVPASNQLSVLKGDNSSQRIIWILFDELSYHQTFDHRASNLHLLNFDRMRSESVSFSNLKPVGFTTDRVIPSLLLGQQIDEIRSTMKGQLWYKDEPRNRWVAYDPNSTLFELAKQYGWNSGIDGWMIPYCRIFGSVVNFCTWEPEVLSVESYGASDQKSILANAAILPRALFQIQANHRSVWGDGRFQNYLNVMTRAKALIEDSRSRFLFIHLNVPHPPGIFDRNAHKLRPRGTYLDNLMLADDSLETLLKEISATPAGDETTVIVSSDHSWRIPIWRHTDLWTREEEAASGGVFDDRPVLLIHFPRQKAGVEVDSQMPEIIEHDIIAEMLRGQMESSDALVSYLAGRGR